MSDFSTQPNSAIEEKIGFAIHTVEYETGIEQRRARHADSRRRWKLVYSNRPTSQMETVRDFFIAKKGSLTSFTWTNPNDSVEYDVRFEDQELRITRDRYARWNWEMTFIEVK